MEKPEPLVAAVLDAAYAETKEGAILREAAVYPSREFFEELASVREKWGQEVLRLSAEAAKEERRKRRGQGGGPSL
jgi:hypothetical protein